VVIFCSSHHKTLSVIK